MCKQRINILWCHRAILYEPWILSENGSIKELSSTKNSAKLRVVCCKSGINQTSIPNFTLLRTIFGLPICAASIS